MAEATTVKQTTHLGPSDPSHSMLMSHVGILAANTDSALILLNPL